jgi:Domain of unknown function (DUF1929)
MCVARPLAASTSSGHPDFHRLGNMTRLRQLRHPTLAVLLAAATLRCGDNVQPPTASSIEMADGNEQIGIAGQSLANPLVVLVTDEDGEPVEGVSVLWDPQDAGSVSSETVETGSDGRASVTRVLGPAPGEQVTTASVNGLEGSPVTFVATATDGETPILAMQTQPSSAAQSGVEFAVQPVVQLKDPAGNDLAQSGLDVTASIVGTGTLGGTVTQATDASGLATFTDLKITGPAGSYTLQFTAPGTTQAVSTPITIGGAAAGIVITTNPPVSALSGEVFDPSVQPVVEVTDEGGNPAAGVQVTATKASGSGTLEGNTSATTDAAGVARFGDLGISGTGSHTLEFTAGTPSVISSPVDVSALPPEATSGDWGPVVPWDIVPLHMNLMPNGKILAWGKTDVGADTMGMPRIWDPASGSPSGLPMIDVDSMLFCAGHALMPDGRLMVAGGHLQDDRGIATTYFFDENGAPQRGPDMAHARWYPTLTVLPDGKMLSMAGRNEAGTVVRTPEIFEGGQWVELPGAGTVEIPYYPRNFVPPSGPSGRIFYSGERISSRWFDVNASGVGGGRGAWSDGPDHIWAFNRDYGTAVMYEPGKILYAGGGGHTGWPTPDAKSNAPTATAEKIDLNQANPQWQDAGSMSSPRRHLNSTILPDGQVLITGGTRGGGFVNIDPGLAVRAAEVWNPATGDWTTLASNSKMRVYHSVSLLLPDGTVLHGASGDAKAIQPGGAIVDVPNEENHEIFSPPYLFKGARPTISSAPATVAYGQEFAVATPNAAQITDVRWIRLGTVTHAFDMGQRANTLTFTRTATGVQVTAPASSNLAPPGHYMLFVLNRNGVPSEGKVVRVQ